MSEIRGAWVPHSPEEDALLMDLHEATRTAYNAGVETEDIVAGMNYLAAAIALYGDESGFVEAADEAPTRPEKVEQCPECNTEIETVLMGMGGNGEIVPCGCLVSFEDVPGWVDLPGEDD